MNTMLKVGRVLALSAVAAAGFFCMASVGWTYLCFLDFGDRCVLAHFPDRWFPSVKP